MRCLMSVSVKLAIVCDLWREMGTGDCCGVQTGKEKEKDSG